MNQYLNFLSKILISASLLTAIMMKSFMSVWIFMEMNLLSFLLWQFSIKDRISMVKYFLIQAFFSSLMMFLYITNNFMVNSKLLTTLTMLTILSKMGTPPMYLWFINFCVSAKIKTLFLAATLQKVIPYTMLFNFCYKININWVFFMMLISLLGIHQTMNIKKLMAFSSIFNMSWIFLSMNNLFLMNIFMLFYALNLALLFMFISQNKNTLNFSDIFLTYNKPIFLIFILLNIMSMMGVPPLNGFFAKILILEFCFSHTSIFNLMMLMIFLSNMFFIYAYLRIIFLALIFYSPTTFLKNKNFTKFFNFFSLFNLFPFMMMM